ncbi:MAG: hypothetical protein AAB526_00500 [Patescibacteria group bacterium]
MKMFFYILLIIIANIVQISFLSHFDLLKNINLILIIIILSTMTDYSLALSGSIIGGFLLDLYSSFWFGSSIIALFVMAVIVKNIFNSYFNKYHLFSYPVIGFIGILSYNLILATVNNFFYWINLNKFIFIVNKFYWINLAEQIILNIILIILFYLFAIWMHTKLQNFFIKL